MRSVFVYQLRIANANQIKNDFLINIFIFNVCPVTVLGQQKVVGSERLGPLSGNIEQMSYNNEASPCQN
jgi:hypothetical protein